MELTITKGRGYVSADKNKNEELPIAVIPIDSIYTPVERVNLTVENTRVGQITDFDKLTLDVYTDGTLMPDEAVSLAAKVLSEHLKLFIDLSEVAQAAEGAGNEHRRTGTVCSFLQLSEESRHQYGRRTDQPDTGRYDEGAESGKKIPGGSPCKIRRAGIKSQQRRRVRYSVSKSEEHDRAFG